MKSREIGKLINKEETEFSGLDVSGFHNAIYKKKKRKERVIRRKIRLTSWIY